MAHPSEQELLQYFEKDYIMNSPDIKEKIEAMVRNKYLEMHTHKKWQSKDGSWCTYLPDENMANHRRFVKKRSEKKLDEAIIEYWKNTENNPTIKEVFNEWNDRRLQRQQIKKSTFTRNSELFNRYYNTFGVKRIKNVSQSEWEDFLCNLIYEYNLTAKAFGNIKGITKGFLKRAKKRGLISMNVETFMLELDISDRDFKKQIIDDEKEVFFDDEIDKIMNYIKENICMKNLGVALMFVTGIRIGELVALRHEDFDGTMFKIRRTETRFRKDSNSYQCEVEEFPKTPAGYRTVFVPTGQKWILDKIMELNPDDGYLIVDKNGNRMNTDMIRKRLRLICDKVGVPRKSPHKIRKTYGSILLDNNVDRKTIENQMGHTDISCTERFYHRNRKRIADKQNIFDSIPEFQQTG